MTIFDDFKQTLALIIAERREDKIIEDKQLNLASLSEGLQEGFYPLSVSVANPGDCYFLL
jgi:hypothetical protein